MFDLGSDCSLIRETKARSMQVEPERTDSIMSAFNNTAGIPVAQLRTGYLHLQTTFSLKPLFTLYRMSNLVRRFY